MAPKSSKNGEACDFWDVEVPPDPWAYPNRLFEKLAATSMEEGSQPDRAVAAVVPELQEANVDSSATLPEPNVQSAFERVDSWLHTPERPSQDVDENDAAPVQPDNDPWGYAALYAYERLPRPDTPGAAIPYNDKPAQNSGSPFGMVTNETARAGEPTVSSSTAAVKVTRTSRRSVSSSDYPVPTDHRPSHVGINTRGRARDGIAQQSGSGIDAGEDDVPEQELRRIEAMRKMMQDAENSITVDPSTAEDQITPVGPYGADILSQIVTFAAKIQEGRPNDSPLALTPSQQEGIDPIYPDAIIPEDSFRPHSEHDLAQMRIALAAVTSQESYFIPITPTSDLDESSDQEEDDLIQDQPPPPKRVRPFYPVAYGVRNLMPRSGLIRDAVQPSAHDNSEDAQVYRAATRNPFPFTFVEHWVILRNCVMDGLVVELNKKLAAGLWVDADLPLLRNTRDEDCVDDRHRQMVAFGNSRLQRRINWMPCEEHFKLLDGLDWTRPDLDLEEMDGLVKATGQWLYEAARRRRR